MKKSAQVALGLVAAIIFWVLYYFFSGSPPLTTPEKAQGPEANLRIIRDSEPEGKSAEKPGTAAPPASTPLPAPGPPPPQALQEQPRLLLPQPPAPPEKPLTKPGAVSPAPEKTALPPLEPKKESGLLIGSYHRYADAAKMMEKLKKQGQPAFIRQEKGKYQVWAGPFSTPQEAQAAANALKGKTRISAKVHRIETPVPK